MSVTHVRLHGDAVTSFCGILSPPSTVSHQMIEMIRSNAVPEFGSGVTLCEDCLGIYNAAIKTAEQPETRRDVPLKVRDQPVAVSWDVLADSQFPAGKSVRLSIVTSSPTVADMLFEAMEHVRYRFSAGRPTTVQVINMDGLGHVHILREEHAALPSDVLKRST